MSILSRIKERWANRESKYLAVHDILFFCSLSSVHTLCITITDKCVYNYHIHSWDHGMHVRKEELRMRDWEVEDLKPRLEKLNIQLIDNRRK